jgi:hypothetical protein
MNGSWQYKCRLGSNMGTAVLYAAWPMTILSAEFGAEIPDLEMRPGGIAVLPPGVKREDFAPAFNMPIVQAMMQQVESGIQQSTFPAIMHGDAGTLQAGYAVNLLTNSAMGRVSSTRGYMELAMQQVHELVLSLIEHNGDKKKGVELFAINSADKQPYTEKLLPKEIGGSYRNIVNLHPPLPQDDNAKIMMGAQLADKHYISSRTFRANFLPQETPVDEESLIWLEMMDHDEEISPRVQVGQAILKWPDNWQQYIRQTKYEQAAKDMGLWDYEEGMRLDELAQPPAPPPGDMMGGMTPPMPPPMPPPGNPPMAPPPQAPPIPPSAGMSSPGGAPLGIQQPPQAMPGPMGGGMPPELNNQISPEMLGLNRQEDQMLFQQLVNSGMSPEEVMQRIAQMSQGGGPPPQGV